MNMHNICKQYAQNMLKIYTKYAVDMQEYAGICTKYAVNMPGICLTYAANMLLYAWNMHEYAEICQ